MRTPLPLIAGIALFLGAASISQGAILSYTIQGTSEISGSGATFGGYIVATFDDGGGTGSVKLTIDLTNVTGPDGLKLTGFYFNSTSNPAIDLSDSLFSGQAYTSFQEDLTLNNPNGGGALKADGDGNFDYLLSYPESGDIFTKGETSVITLTGTGITANSFSAISVNGPAGNTGYNVVARVISLTTGSGSGFFSEPGPEPSPLIPEPTSIVAWLLGAGGLGLILRRRMKKPVA